MLTSLSVDESNPWEMNWTVNLRGFYLKEQLVPSRLKETCKIYDGKSYVLRLSIDLMEKKMISH